MTTEPTTTARTELSSADRRPWLDYRSVWRWHFYAGLLCIPFVLWLACTGTIYLFKPQVESWLDRPYTHLHLDGPAASPAAQAAAAVAAAPGSRLRAYQLPDAPDSAAQVLVGQGDHEYRIYVHPQTLQVLHQVDEDSRLMRIVFRLHGELMIGDRGSMLVELAASWAIVMILTGLFLWWPRQARGLGGVLYPRLGQSGRVFWRDLHAVTGLWVSAFALTFLLSGLPWAKSWGGELKLVRRAIAGAPVSQDWTTGRSSELARRRADNAAPGDEHAMHHHHTEAGGAPQDYTPLDRLAAVVAPLQLAPPVLIAPPSGTSPNWTARSDTQNRPQRISLVLDGASGAVLERKEFGQKPLLDRIIGVGIAAHEGHLFGWLNQLGNLLIALGLVTLSLSALKLWWGRRPAGVLGAPLPQRPPRFVPLLVLPVLLLGVVLPLFGITLVAVLVLERLVLRRIPPVRDFLGLNTIPPAPQLQA